MMKRLIFRGFVILFVFYTLVLLSVSTLALTSYNFTQNFYQFSNHKSTESLSLNDVASLKEISLLDFVSWTCDFNQVPSTLLIQNTSCFCIDSNPGLSTTGSKVGLGYGNILSCLKDSAYEIQVETPSSFTSGSGLLSKISVVYKDELVDFGEVELTTSSFVLGLSSDISCEVAENDEDYDIVYTYYRQSPFSVLATTRDSFYALKNSVVKLNYGDDIFCRANFYKSGVLYGSKDSTNSLTLSDNSLFVSNVYVAPVYPTVADNLFCYGQSSFQFDDSFLLQNNLKVFHNLTLFYSNHSVLYNSFVETVDSSRKAVSLNVSLLNKGVQKGDSFYCTYSLGLYNESAENFIDFDTLNSYDVIVKNSIPYLTSLYINTSTLLRDPRGDPVLFVYNSNGEKVAEFSDSGDIALAGNIVPLSECGTSVFDFLNSENILGSIDNDGNYCGKIESKLFCQGDSFALINKANYVLVGSVGDTLCHVGLVVQQYDFNTGGQS